MPVFVMAFFSFYFQFLVTVFFGTVNWKSSAQYFALTWNYRMNSFTSPHINTAVSFEKLWIHIFIVENFMLITSKVIIRHDWIELFIY